jgi:hypothetical protein
MSILVIQTITRQWDKSQRTPEHIEAREQLPDRYAFNKAKADSLFSGKVLLEQHGDDTLGDRIQYELFDGDKFIIDCFGFDMGNKEVAYFPPEESGREPELVTTMEDGWIQCQYEWRYRVEEGGAIYWLYELFTINARFVDSLSDDVFMSTEPETVFNV